jgi:hypothetical protein
MRSAVVMPCLNEEATLAEACLSLGFGRGASQNFGTDTTLVLVDNGSEDATWSVMEQIQRNSPPSSVVLIREPERGYVPPRHRGVLEARRLAQCSGIGESGFLVVQADADTLYSEGYVFSIAEIAKARSGNYIVEGICTAPASFDARYPGYGSRSASADSAVAHLWVREEDDIIVDDKACAYTLENYFRWGGHRREYASDGEEIHAETTRLYTKAHLTGARRKRAEKAIAWPSRRKIVEEPIVHFATMGFPRERKWREHWQMAGARLSLDDFGNNESDKVLAEATHIRSAHAIILFALLPAYVARLVGSSGCGDQEAEFSDLLPMLAPLTRADVLENTAILFERGFAIIDKQLPQLIRRMRI